MTGSNSSRIAGSANTTVTILIRAPRAISMQREEITEIPEYIPTPKVAAKNDIALTNILCIDVGTSKKPAAGSIANSPMISKSK